MLKQVFLATLMIMYSSDRASMHNHPEDQDAISINKINNINKTKKKKVLIVSYSMQTNKNPMPIQLQAALQEKGINADLDRIITHAFETWAQRAKITTYTMLNQTVEIEPMQFDPQDYEIIVFIFPVWSNNVALPIISYMELYKAKLESKQKICFLVKCREESMDAHLAFGTFNRMYDTEFALQPVMITTEDVNTGKSLDKIKEMVQEIQMFFDDKNS